LEHILKNRLILCSGRRVCIIGGDWKVEQLLIYEVDLTKIQGNGDFRCPKCGVIISPDDETDEVYCIMEKKVRNKSLEALIIQCQKCRSEIRLIGFSMLNIDEN
jgi:predicted RNA-binding Zn-ribbon protein involved in translation (DUF1610 family)